jgi:hypothetical protein
MRPKNLTLGAAALSLLVATAPVARADHGQYVGGCSFLALNDTTPDGSLGGQNQWTGEIDTVVVATDWNGIPMLASVDVECELLVNGVSQGVVLSASGTTVAASAGPFSYTAQEGDVVTLCDHVRVDWHTTTQCHDAVNTPLIPQPVVDVLDLLLDTTGQVVDLVNEISIQAIDPILCPVLAALAPGVPGIVDIDGDDGDVYVLGAIFWDCPPYGDGGGEPGAFPVGFDVSTSSLGINGGEAGFELVFSDDLGVGTRAEGHGITSACAFGRAGGSTTIKGRTHLPRHREAQQAYIRCTVKDKATGAALYTQERWQAGDVAEIEDTFAAPRKTVLICDHGKGEWTDAHARDLGERCS